MENVVDEKKEGETWTAFFYFLFLWTQTLFYLK